jgi:acyl-CoA reductase-like NAD-dependent aldehyde dehydrogenase
MSLPSNPLTNSAGGTGAGAGGARVERTISPVDGSTLVEFALATDAEIGAALARAASAQLAWRRAPLAERAAICRRMTAAMVDKADAIGTELTWQMGRPVAYSPFEIKRGFQERALYMIDAAGDALADIVMPPRESFQRFIRREPVGVVLVLAPWNYPYLASVNAVVPAIMAGNSVILKVAPQTPLVANRYADAFREAGLPEGVFQFLHVTHDDVARIIGDPRIAFVAFTGSVPGGHAVQQAAAARFIATNLELGGKDPAYVRADAPLDFAIENLVDGACFNSGQSCCAIERIYVHRDVYDRFVEGAVKLTREYRLGNPLEPDTTLGPMVRTAAADVVRAQIADAVRGGARALLDPRDFPADREGTPYLAPQLLVDVTHDMRVMQDETFGPIAGIMPVEDDEEAVRLMNDSRYGLTASIWTADAEAAVRIGDRIDTGTWFMNRCDYLDPALAWTGVKDSGRGWSLSARGYDALTRPKSFHLRLRI